MNVKAMNVSVEQAQEALKTYKQHRDVFDNRDWEIERIYRQIAKGKLVISAFDAIRSAGLDERGRPHLALMRADQQEVRCVKWRGELVFINIHRSNARDLYFKVPYPGLQYGDSLRALLPRIPPQHRPVQGALRNYHILWEADWEDIPRDPLLLKRIGTGDAWVVLAAWDLTDVEINVLRNGSASR